MALERDNYLCQQCLKQDLIIYADVVHHIIHLTEDITKAFELENLESLCHSCHNKEHPEKGGDIRKRNEPKRNVRVIKA